jgi:hypothetical protein
LNVALKLFKKGTHRKVVWRFEMFNFCHTKSVKKIE